MEINKKILKALNNDVDIDNIIIITKNVREVDQARHNIKTLLIEEDIQVDYHTKNSVRCLGKRIKIIPIHQVEIGTKGLTFIPIYYE